MPVNITHLFSYPIKSCAGVAHTETNITTMGLANDRQFMLVDQSGVFLSQRKHPQMALIKPKLKGHELFVNAPGMEELSINIAENNNTSLAVDIWHDKLLAESFQIQVNQWFSTYLKMPVQLVKYGSNSHRLIDPDYNPQNQTVAFADGFPLLITHQATLKQLNEKLTNPVNMDRFRPNIVVNTDLAAWDELNWQRLSSDDCNIDLLKPCSRCVITGVNQNRGTQTGTEVLKTLKKQFVYRDKAVFGVYGIISKKQKSVSLSVGQSLGLLQNNSSQNH